MEETHLSLGFNNNGDSGKKKKKQKNLALFSKFSFMRKYEIYVRAILCILSISLPYLVSTS